MVLPVFPQGYVPREAAIKKALESEGFEKNSQSSIYSQYYRRKALFREQILEGLEKQARGGMKQHRSRYAPWSVRMEEVEADGQVIICFHLEDYLSWAKETALPDFPW